MSDDSENREMGIQPLDSVLEKLDLSNADLVSASTEQLTHKQVQKARKGRRVTENIQGKILRALKSASSREWEMKELFNY